MMHEDTAEDGKKRQAVHDVGGYGFRRGEQ